MDKPSMLDKFKYFIGLDDLEEEYEEEYEPQDEKKSKIINKNNKKNKIVNIHTNSNIKLIIYEPKNLEEATKLVDDLKNRRPIVVNLQNLDGDMKRRVFDFITGALFALEGKIQKVSKGIFILAPNNVEIDSNIKEEFKNKGIFPWLK